MSVSARRYVDTTPGGVVVMLQWSKEVVEEFVPHLWLVHVGSMSCIRHDVMGAVGKLSKVLQGHRPNSFVILANNNKSGHLQQHSNTASRVSKTS